MSESISAAVGTSITRMAAPLSESFEPSAESAATFFANCFALYAVNLSIR